jgi:hypothetical protein
VAEYSDLPPICDSLRVFSVTDYTKWLPPIIASIAARFNAQTAAYKLEIIVWISRILFTTPAGIYFISHVADRIGRHQPS